jgi:phosphate-selective porin OprO/OprP
MIYLGMRPLFRNIAIAAAACFLLLFASGRVHAESPPSDNIDSMHKALSERVAKGIHDPVTGYHIFWQQRLYVASPKKNLLLKIGGKVIVDGGNIDADDELQRAFPDLDGSDIDFRNLSVDIFGTIFNSVDIRVEIDFANAQDMKDNWIRFSKTPYLKDVRFGHMKEPFSLEELTGITSITFMERALPVQAFSPGRNFGIRYDRPLSDSPINWSTGIFLNTGSFGTFGEGSNQLSGANGFDLTARVTGVPWYAQAGRKLLHLGLSYTHGFRDGEDIRFRSRPESRLTDERLVDTGSFQADGIDKIDAELAVVSGPLSFQGELFYTATDADPKGDPDFWGAYANLSYFITGEYREYNRARGVFAGREEHYRFRPLKGEWGAWELGLRYSYVDLNDSGINGGEESNFTAGLNWYHHKNIRVMFNYINARVEDRPSRSIEESTADIFQTRFQIVF